MGTMTRRARRALGLAAAAAATAAVATVGLAPTASAAGTLGTGSWAFYGFFNPIGPAWTCGPTTSLSWPYYLSYQDCVIKQRGYEQVATVVTARAINRPVTGAFVAEISFREVLWQCPAKPLQWGVNVCYGGTAAYRGTVRAEGGVRIDVQSDGFGTSAYATPVSA